jgi:hypothetical protein
VQVGGRGWEEYQSKKSRPPTSYRTVQNFPGEKPQLFALFSAGKEVGKTAFIVFPVRNFFIKAIVNQINAD